MGLDMYLQKNYFIGVVYDYLDVKGKIEISKSGEKIPINLKEVMEITCSGIYWRKANQIHNWFVENVQNGNDDCNKYYVSVKQLKELLDLCLQVRDNPELASELLPTQDGFFFGSNDYDEDYFYDIEDTITELSKINLMEEPELYSFEYYSSW